MTDIPYPSRAFGGAVLAADPTLALELARVLEEDLLYVISLAARDDNQRPVLVKLIRQHIDGLMDSVELWMDDAAQQPPD
jgi:hypothetical protein